MKTFKLKNTTPCPYGLKMRLELGSIELNNPIFIGGLCPSCKYHVKRVWIGNSNDCYITCKYKSFSDKLKIAKDLLD